MSAHEAASPLHLNSAAGRLVMVRTEVADTGLERLLDAIGRLPFPVNPAIDHRGGVSIVEFPAYREWVDSIRRDLRAEAHVEVAEVEVCR